MSNVTEQGHPGIQAFVDDTGKTGTTLWIALVGGRSRVPCRAGAADAPGQACRTRRQS